MRSRDQWLPLMLLSVVMVLKLCTILALCSTSCMPPKHVHHEHTHSDENHHPSLAVEKKNKQNSVH